eukprot:COSAG02_NODE_7152_length_3153_cov_1.608055_4_plen_134_part_00
MPADSWLGASAPVDVPQPVADPRRHEHLMRETVAFHGSPTLKMPAATGIVEAKYTGNEYDSLQGSFLVAAAWSYSVEDRESRRPVSVCRSYALCLGLGRAHWRVVIDGNRARPAPLQYPVIAAAVLPSHGRHI